MPKGSHNLILLNKGENNDKTRHTKPTSVP